MGLLDFFGLGTNDKMLEELTEKGAVVIDVRSKQEYSGGHIKGSQNIPLDQIDRKINDIKKLGKPVITCCASGMRSGTAAGKLNNAGIEAINGGGWNSLARKLG